MGGAPVAATAGRTAGRALPDRAAVAGAFALHGAVMASFAGRIPALQERLGIGTAELGLGLLMISLGCVTTMQPIAVLAQRTGQRAVLVACFLLLGVSLTAAALAPNLLVFCVALLLAGVGSGSADVAFNALGVHVERRIGRSVMSGLHGLWSIGGVLGAGLAAVCAHAGVTPAVQFAGMVGVVLLVSVVGWRGWADPAGSRPEEVPGFAWPSRQVWAVGVVAFLTVVAELAGTDWSAVFLTDVRDAPAAVAALGVLAVAGAMAVGRLGGDSVVRRVGPVRTVRVGAAVALVGVAVVIAAPSVPAGLAGFALLGLGIATVVPLCFAAAGRLGGEHPGRQIAAVATLGYGAGMAAPSLLGAIAQLTTLPIAFGVVAVGLVAVGALAPVLRTET